MYSLNVQPKTLRSLFFISALTLPLLSLLLAYTGIALYTDNWWPWLEIAHESGDRTLLGTVFYFEHASRELPLDIILGVAIGGSVLSALPRCGTTNAYLRFIFVAASSLLIAIIVLGTIWTGGLSSLWENLSQLHTRPGAPLDFGSHWRYHFLSRLSLILISFGLSGLVVSVSLSAHKTNRRSGRNIFLGSLGLFLFLTMLFGLSSDPFIDPVYLGHQIREVFTHGLVTIPLAWWLCLVISGSGGIATADKWSRVSPMFAGIGGISLALYLLLGALLTSSVSHGQSENLSLLIFPHFFEHMFSYLIVSLIAGLVCLLK